MLNRNSENRASILSWLMPKPGLITPEQAFYAIWVCKPKNFYKYVDQHVDDPTHEAFNVKCKFGGHTFLFGLIKEYENCESAIRSYNPAKQSKEYRDYYLRQNYSEQKETYLKMIRYLLSKVDVNTIGDDALHYAAGARYLKEIVPILLEFGADPLVRSKNSYYQYQVCSRASSQGSSSDVIKKMLIDAERNALKECVVKLEDLFDGIKGKDETFALSVELYLDRYDHDASKLDIPESKETGVTLLMRAVESGAKEIVQLLLDRKANVNATDEEGKTALHYGCKSFYPDKSDIVNILLKQGANVHAIDTKGNAPLHYAQDLDTAETLLKSGADANAKDAEGKTFLHRWEHPFDCYGESKKVVHELVKYGANVDAQDDKGNTPLHLAVQHGFFYGFARFVKSLLHHKADISILNHENKTASDVSRDEYAKYLKPFQMQDADQLREWALSLLDEIDEKIKIIKKQNTGVFAPQAEFLENEYAKIFKYTGPFLQEGQLREFVLDLLDEIDKKNEVIERYAREMDLNNRRPRR
ncbi:MAG: ankyrin repeat domain-containing protein [Gammaproteobacteria bacterium]|nr:ankyrin repeat domain-containing protein [Gammaproteobacteria bacterium]